MKCPDQNQIIAEWQRAQRGEPMQLAAHLIECDNCRASYQMLSTTKTLLKESEKLSQQTHPDPAQQAAFAENRISPDQREQMIAHLADCPECRETVSALVKQSSSSKKASISIWQSVFRKSELVLSGVLATLLVICLFPMPIHRSSEVTITGTKSGASSVESAMRAIDPSSSDLDFAIAVWERVAAEHPEDAIAKQKLAQLKAQKARR